MSRGTAQTGEKLDGEEQARDRSLIDLVIYSTIGSMRPSIIDDRQV